MKKPWVIGTIIALFLGLAGYSEFSGWTDIVEWKLLPNTVLEEKASGVVGNLRELTLKSDKNEKSHIKIFSLISDDGVVLNLGIDYDNFAFREGDRIEITFLKQIEKGEGIDDYRAEWYPLRSYRLLKAPTPAEK